MYLGYLNLAVWRCYISFLSRWCGSDVLLYGGLHTYSFVYVVDPFACRLRRPFLSCCLEMVGTAERSTCVGIWAPPYYFNHFRTSRLESRNVIHRGSYTYQVVFLLQEFDLHIVDRKGAENLVADNLSRLKNISFDPLP